ncbi:MAG: UDP-2,3-diacylglucosamine diphosphatase [Proteobacteria bacterium]|nr:UDP-2,3-diacylglucosamine diphosphatase [Pseudomonadota bacterium]MDA1299295.1 UDP-2,3-diacylglucosamine diphosphatase [Pseudomonadota bacterium]
MTSIFISDLHLDDARPDVTDAFLAFLTDGMEGVEQLFILGDLFEVWLGDDDDSPFNRRIIHALAELTIPRYFLHGNRDFLIGHDFCIATGLELLSDPTTIDLYGRRVLLMHGDSLCTRDTAYMAARKMLRNPDTTRDLLSRSLEERAAIARGARDESRAHTRETAMDIMDVTPQDVVSTMNDHDVTTMIHGHTHRPNVHDVNLGKRQGTRIVLGDWDQKGWYLRFDQQGYSLESFDIGTPL